MVELQVRKEVKMNQIFGKKVSMAPGKTFQKQNFEETANVSMHTFVGCLYFTERIQAKLLYSVLMPTLEFHVCIVVLLQIVI